MTVQPRSDSRPSLGQFVQVGQGHADAFGSPRHLPGVAGKFLTKRNRYGVHHVGATDLDDVAELACLFTQDRVQVLKGRYKTGVQFFGGGNVHRRRESVVRALSQVDVIVRVHRMFAAQPAAENLDGAIGNHLVDVHVGVGAGSGLPDDKGEMIVEGAVDHFVGRAADCVGYWAIQQPKLLMDRRHRFFYHTECPEKGTGHPVAADGEIIQGSLGLGAPVPMGRNFHRTEGIRLGARIHHGPPGRWGRTTGLL